MSIATRISLIQLKSICSSLFRNETIKPLGRWSVNKNKNHNLFIDYANEDHCGSCGDYLKNKIKQRKILTELEENLVVEYSSLVLNTPS
jgi:hypothetical protein